MKKIFVTVGTSKFEGLVKTLDKIQMEDTEVVIQKADGQYEPTLHLSVDFVNNVDQFYLDADLVITHAGAGSIYRLLEMGVNFIAVPNLERSDKHQNDICRFLEKNSYGYVCWDLKTLNKLIERALERGRGCLKPYVKNEFFVAPEILDFVSQKLS